MVAPVLPQVSALPSGTQALSGTAALNASDLLAGNAGLFATLLASQLPATEPNALLTTMPGLQTEAFTAPQEADSNTLPLLSQISDALRRNASEGAGMEEAGLANLKDRASQAQFALPASPESIQTAPEMPPLPTLAPATQPILTSSTLVTQGANKGTLRSTAEGNAQEDDDDTRAVEMFGAAQTVGVQHLPAVQLGEKRASPSAVTDAIGGELPGSTKNMPEAAILAAQTRPQGEQSATNATIASAASSTSNSASNRIELPIHDSGWKKEFGNQLVWMVKNEQQTARIEINPPHLGPLQISLHLNGDQATAVFASPHAEVRQAIQDGMSQLRDQFASAGLNLAQADVGSQGGNRQQEMFGQNTGNTRNISETAILPGIAQTGEQLNSRPIQQGRGLVDLFA